MNCYYHPDRESVAVCSVCKKPLCKECAHEKNGKIYCSDCLGEAKTKQVRSTFSFPAVALITVIIVAALIVSLIALRRANIFPIIPQSNSLQTQDIEKDFSGETSLAVELNLSAMKKVTINGTDAKLYSLWSSTNQEIKAKYANGKLTIDYPNNKRFTFLNNPNETLALSITNKIPVNIVLKLGAGNTEIDGGSIPFENLTLESGAGSIDVKEGTVKNLNISLGAGNIDISQIKAAQNIKINNGVGNTSLDISKIESNCLITINNGVGNTSLTVSKSKGVKVYVRTIKFEGNGFIKEDDYYVNDAFNENGAEIVVNVSSVGNVTINEQ